MKVISFMSGGYSQYWAISKFMDNWGKLLNQNYQRTLQTNALWCEHKIQHVALSSFGKVKIFFFFLRSFQAFKYMDCLDFLKEPLFLYFCSGFLLAYAYTDTFCSYNSGSSVEYLDFQCVCLMCLSRHTSLHLFTYQ